MSTIAFKALLIREINLAMDRAQQHARGDGYSNGDGQLEAYAHVLQLIQEDDL